MRGMDFIDTASAFLSVGLLTSVPPLGFVASIVSVSLAVARRSSAVQVWILGEGEVERNAVINFLLPPPKKALPKPKEDRDEGLFDGLLSRPSKEKKSKTEVIEGEVVEGDGWGTVTGETKKLAPIRRENLERALQKLPRPFGLLSGMHPPKSRTAIPIGIDSTGKQVWFDIDARQKNTVYSMSVTGKPGSGKDNVFKAWFETLTRRCEPSEVQFVFIDGKGGWCLPWIEHNRYMFIPPVDVSDGDEALAAATSIILAEMKRRIDIIKAAGCEDREEYLDENPGEQMPLLMVVLTDIMGELPKDVDQMLVKLVSKARSSGLRVSISMQTMTRQNTQWLSSIGAAMSGALTGAAQDAVVMGCEAADLTYRPSQLPPPPDSAGIFVVRSGDRDWLVRTPMIDKAAFKAYCKALPQKKEATFPVSLPTTGLADIDLGLFGETGKETPPRETGNAEGNADFDEENFLKELVIRDHRQRKEEFARIQFRAGATVDGCNDMLKSVYGAGLKTNRLTELRREALAK